MKLFLLFFLGTLFFSYNQLNAQLSTSQKAAIYANGYMGTEYIVAFPPNENETMPKQDLAMFISSLEDTEITLSTSAGVFYQTTVKAEDGAVFSAFGAPGTHPLSWTFENWVMERIVSDKAIMISSEKPIGVYVMNSKITSSEGYRAIPIKSWGREYQHLSFWDFNEVRQRGGGFQVLAAEDDTEVTIELKGRGKNLGETSNGTKIGDVIRVTLNKGELYQIQGDGTTRGVFDLSGSSISSNKPVGVISYHNRTMIPKFVVQNGRDNLMAMMPPMESWGTDYVATELNRGTDKGDYFRVIAAENDTEVNIRWYDKESGQLIDSKTNILDEGEFWSPYDKDGDNSQPNLEGIRGVTHISSDKAILVMQYSYSALWDATGSDFDPFMFPLSPRRYWGSSLHFTTPKNNNLDNEFHTNYLMLHFKGDTLNQQRHDSIINSITLDGKALKSIYPNAGEKWINGTDIFYEYISLDAGHHVLNSSTQVGGYIYGFAMVDSYGWPVGGNIISNYDKTGIDIDKLSLDTKIKQSLDKSYIDLAVYTSQNAGLDLINEPIMSNESEEGSLKIELRDKSNTLYADTVFEGQVEFYRLSPTDPTVGSVAKLGVATIGGIKSKMIDLTFAPSGDINEKLSFSADELLFEEVNLGSTKSLMLTVDSEDEKPSKLSDISVSSGYDFTLSDNQTLPLDNIQDLELEVSFTPEKHMLSKGPWVHGELTMISSAGEYSIPMSGKIMYSDLKCEELIHFYYGEERHNNPYSFILANDGNKETKISDISISIPGQTPISIDQIKPGDMPNYEITKLYSGSAIIGEGAEAELLEIVYTGDGQDSLDIHIDYNTEMDISGNTSFRLYSDVVLSVDSNDSEEFSVLEPSEGTFVIKSQNVIHSYSIFNTKGESLTSKTVNSVYEIRVDLVNYPSGLYLVQFKSNDRVKTIKLFR